MGALILILQVVRWVVLADVVLSWIQRDPNEQPRRLTRTLTQPLYAPFQAMLPAEKTGGFDLSPLFVLIGLSVIQRVIL